jgi:hypothetical protein
MRQNPVLNLVNPNKIVSSLLEDEDPVEKQLADKLTASGIEASYEHPGFVAIKTKIGELAVGTVDGFWGFNFHDEEGNAIDSENPEWSKFWDQMPDPDKVSVDKVASEVKKLVNWANSQS